jgi:galactokinase
VPTAASFTATAPGRVNLIGEHTDYNFGFVLPTVIPQTCRVRCTYRDDNEVTVASENQGGQAVRYELGSETALPSERHWWHYVQGVTWVLRKHGHRLRGCDLRIESDVPLGSGLSSSAALDVALLRVFREAFVLKLDDMSLVKLAQEVENRFVGAPVGILDPLACHLGAPGQALFVDTQSLEIERVPLPAGVELIVIHSGVEHRHAGGDYATRVAECREASRQLGVPNLRSCTPDDLPRIGRLNPPLAGRARHVVTENQRVVDAVAAMKAGDLRRLGELFDASHASQRDDYGVSIAEVDLLVSVAQQHPHVYGARLTGGGFGGSIVALAEEGKGAEAAREIARMYQERTKQESRVLVPM